MDAFLAYLTGRPALHGDRQDEFTIDGHRAVEIAVPGRREHHRAVLGIRRERGRPDWCPHLGAACRERGLLERADRQCQRHAGRDRGRRGDARLRVGGQSGRHQWSSTGPCSTRIRFLDDAADAAGLVADRAPRAWRAGARHARRRHVAGASGRSRSREHARADEPQAPGHRRDRGHEQRLADPERRPERATQHRPDRAARRSSRTGTRPRTATGSGPGCGPSGTPRR